MPVQQIAHRWHEMHICIMFNISMRKVAFDFWIASVLTFSKQRFISFLFVEDMMSTLQSQAVHQDTF